MIRRIAIGGLLVIVVVCCSWATLGGNPSPAARWCQLAVERFKASFAQQAGGAWNEFEELADSARAWLAGGLAKARYASQETAAASPTGLPTPSLIDEIDLGGPSPDTAQLDRAENLSEVSKGA